LPAASDFVAIQAEAGLVAVGAGPELSLWNSSDLKKLTAVTLPTPVSGIVFSQKGNRLTVTTAALLMHYDVVKKGETYELSLLHDSIGHPNNVVALGISPDDRTLWTAAQDNIVRKFQSASPVPRKVLTDAVGPVYSASYSADGRWLATGGADGKLRVWNLATGKIADEAPVSNAVNQVAYSPAGDLLLSGDDGGSVRIWKLAVPMPEANAPPIPAEKLTAKLEPLHEWKCLDGDSILPVRSVIFSTDVNWVLAGTSRGPIFVWKTKEPMVEPVKLEAHNSAVTTLRYNLANNRLASFEASGHVAIWNPGNWAYVAFQRLPVGTSGTGGVYALDGITWILGNRNGQVVLPPVAPAGR
jgi:WD40 repeat protein